MTVELDPGLLPVKNTDEETFCSCFMTVEYSYRGKPYVSMTAVKVFDTK